MIDLKKRIAERIAEREAREAAANATIIEADDIIAQVKGLMLDLTTKTVDLSRNGSTASIKRGGRTILITCEGSERYLVYRRGGNNAIDTSAVPMDQIEMQDALIDWLNA